MFKSKKNKGFTLLELMVVIGVLAILMLAAIPYFLGMQQDAEASNAFRDIKALEGAVMQEYVDHGTDNWADGIADDEIKFKNGYSLSDFGFNNEDSLYLP